MKRKVHRLCFFLACLALLPACATPLRYSAEPIEATVIDAETRKPLDGVIVTANWQLEEGTLGGGNVQAGQLMVMEAVTGPDGKFQFPAWGPKTVWKGHLVNEDPQLLLFKSGYEYKRLYNHVSMSAYREYVLKPVRSSDWNGKTIVMKPFKGMEGEYAKHLGFLATSLNILLDEECGWKKIPNLVLAISKQSQMFRGQGLYVLLSIDSLDIRYRNFENKCGSVKKFFQELQQ